MTKRISQLTPDAAPDATTIFESERAGVSYRLTAAQMREIIANARIGDASFARLGLGEPHDILTVGALISAFSNSNLIAELVSLSNTPSNASRINLLRSRGLSGSPSAVADGDIAGVLQIMANTGSAFISCAGIQAIVEGAPSASFVPARLELRSGSTTEPATPRWVVRPAGHFVPNVASAYDIGEPARPVRNLFAGVASFGGPVLPGQYTLSTLPSAASFPSYEIDVTNATGGPKRCRSNGTVWQILNTTTTVS